MRCEQPYITFQEVPDEVSLTFCISGCPLKCSGCHSQHLWDENFGDELTLERYRQLLDHYGDQVTTILFFGGEWHKDKLIAKLDIARQYGFKTALYTGKDNVPQGIRARLNFLKTGAYIDELGGLDSPITNQKLWNLDNQQLLNFKFVA